ncbi:MAG: PKD domain-containing protein [Candidatus Omnitrophica bacterium]|nr:PKD domain-containing protein [Candidatus Omnitrophota bacterium]
MTNDRMLIPIIIFFFFSFSFYNVYGCYQNPVAKAETVSGKTSFVVGQVIEFTGEKEQPYKFSYDPDNCCGDDPWSNTANVGVGITKYEWDWDSDGNYDAIGSTQSTNYSTTGTKLVTLQVTDDDCSQSGGMQQSKTSTDIITIFIYKIGTFTINATRIFDIPNHPTWHHVRAFQVSLFDSDGNPWDSSHPSVKYEWYNCIDGQYFSSGYTSSYTFETIFKWTILDDVGLAVRGHVFSEDYPLENVYSNIVTFTYINIAP